MYHRLPFLDSRSRRFGSFRSTHTNKTPKKSTSSLVVRSHHVLRRHRHRSSLSLPRRRHLRSGGSHLKHLLQCRTPTCTGRIHRRRFPAQRARDPDVPVPASLRNLFRWRSFSSQQRQHVRQGAHRHRGESHVCSRCLRCPQSGAPRVCSILRMAFTTTRSPSRSSTTTRDKALGSYTRAGPFAFPAKQGSIWINVGLTAAYLQYDIRVKGKLLINPSWMTQNAQLELTACCTSAHHFAQSRGLLAVRPSRPTTDTSSRTRPLISVVSTKSRLVTIRISTHVPSLRARRRKHGSDSISKETCAARAPTFTLPWHQFLLRRLRQPTTRQCRLLRPFRKTPRPL